jgi:hypothetical protein
MIDNQYEPIETHLSTRIEGRKPYRKPTLKILGDLRTLTLGGTPGGTGDSGCEFLEAPYHGHYYPCPE